RFGLSEEVDNQRLLRDLKNCKQPPKESIRLHASRWENLLQRITEKYTENTKITYFIQSLYQRETRLTLTALVETLNLETVAKVIDKAIDLEDRARLADEPQ
ncbi:hypothetical protein EDC96DRAFT_425050, partial [Choanephora cucurbitarum]